VQALLRRDEALVLFLDTREWQPTPEETFIWVVTKTAMRWVRSEIGTPALTREVAALRCGLDDAPWNKADSAEACVEMIKKYRYDAVVDDQFVQVLPFDLERAHALYKALFGQVEDLLKDKHLLIVPSGPLTSLPLGVLVTEPPKTRVPVSVAEYRDVAWLATRASISASRVTLADSAVLSRLSDACDTAALRA
jgi:hypothetical protein